MMVDHDGTSAPPGRRSTVVVSRKAAALAGSVVVVVAVSLPAAAHATEAAPAAARPAAATCSRANLPLPDPTCTPGATYSAVTQSTIGSTICVSGWTSTIRPPTSYTNPLKTKQIRQ